MAHPTKFQKYLDGALSSHDQVARVLGGEILAGIYPAGTKLPHESVILSRFGVSRTVLREVLKTLTAKGLLYSRTRVGTMVLDASHWNYFDADLLSWTVARGFDDTLHRDLTEVRLALEPAAAALAAQHHSAADITELRRAVEAMRAATSSAREFAEADLDFHRAIGKASGNVLMRSISAVVETALVASFTRSSPVREESEHDFSVRGHERIADAIEAGDGVAAAQAMREIIGHGARRIAAARTES